MDSTSGGSDSTVVFERNLHIKGFTQFKPILFSINCNVTFKKIKPWGPQFPIAEAILRKKKKKRINLEVIMSQTSDYITKLQLSKQHGTGTKTDT